MSEPSSSPVVVTGANGLVGAKIVHALGERGAAVRAVVRRAGTAPVGPGIEEVVADFTDRDQAAVLVQGAGAVITTVYPMGSDDLAQQRAVSVEGTLVLARAAAAAEVPVHVHLSTAGVYDRAPGVGDVAEDARLVDDEAGDYPVTKRDTDAALAGAVELDRLTRVLLRPPAILGAGPSSVWNTLRPAQIRDDEDERRAVAEKTFAWVHVADLAALAADLATGRIASAEDPARGPVTGGCTPVNVAGGPATQRDYLGTVTGALGVEPVWEDGEAWTGQLDASRARGWGWQPEVGLTEALAEIETGLTRD